MQIAYNTTESKGYTNLGSPELVDGVFEMPYAPFKPFAFVAAAEGYSTTESSLVEPRAGSPVHVTITLEPLDHHELEVVVENEQGHRVSDSVVELTEQVRSTLKVTLPGATRQAETDANGIALFTQLNATVYRMTAKAETDDSRFTEVHPEGQPGDHRVTIPDESRATIILKAYPKPPIERGQTSMSGEPNQYFTVKPYQSDTPNQTLYMDTRYGAVLRLDGSVRYLWELAQPGVNLIAVSKPGYTAGFEWVEVSATTKPGSIVVPVELGESGLVYGKAVETNDTQAVANRPLSVYPLTVNGRQVPTAIDRNSMVRVGELLAQGVRTDEQGDFTIEFLPAGRYAVFLDRTEPVEVDILPGEKTGPIELVVEDSED